MPIRNAKTPERRIQLMETLLGAGTWTYDLSSRELLWSEGLYRLVGLDSRAVVASFQLYESLVHPDDRLAHEDIVEMAHANRLVVRRFRMIRPDGHLIWLESRVDRQFDRSGRLAILHGVVRDVTDDQNAQFLHNRTHSANVSLRKILGGEFWRADATGRLLDFTYWMRFTGQTTEQLRDYSALDAVHPSDRQRFVETWAAAIAGKERLDLMVRVRRHDGIYQSFESTAVPVLDGDGSILEWHGVSRIPDTLARPRAVPQEIDASHIRAGRAMLEWSAADLAEKASISFSTIRRMEANTETVKVENVQRVRETLERGGVVFLHGPANTTYVSMKTAT